VILGRRTQLDHYGAAGSERGGPGVGVGGRNPTSACADATASSAFHAVIGGGTGLAHEPGDLRALLGLTPRDQLLPRPDPFQIVERVATHTPVAASAVACSNSRASPVSGAVVAQRTVRAPIIDSAEERSTSDANSCSSSCAWDGRWRPSALPAEGGADGGKPRSGRRSDLGHALVPSGAPHPHRHDQPGPVSPCGSAASSAGPLRYHSSHRSYAPARAARKIGGRSMPVINVRGTVPSGRVSTDWA